MSLYFLILYPPHLVECFWYLQRAFKMIFDASETELNNKFNIWVVKTSKSDFSFLNALFFVIFLQFFISKCRTIQIFLPMYPPNLVECFWYLQRAFKMIFDASETVLNKKFNIWSMLNSPKSSFRIIFHHFPFDFTFLCVAWSHFFYQRIPRY